MYSHHDLPRVYREVGVVETPVELLLGNGLVAGVVVRGEVLVSQSLGRRYSLLGVEDEHLLQEIDGGRVGVLELVLERLALALGEGLDEAKSLFPGSVSNGLASISPTAGYSRSRSRLC